jgi:hypothetical protein
MVKGKPEIDGVVCKAGSLFYDDFSVTGLHSVSDRMISE